MQECSQVQFNLDKKLTNCRFTFNFSYNRSYLILIQYFFIHNYFDQICCFAYGVKLCYEVTWTNSVEVHQ